MEMESSMQEKSVIMVTRIVRSFIHVMQKKVKKSHHKVNNVIKLVKQCNALLRKKSRRIKRDPQN